MLKVFASCLHVVFTMKTFFTFAHEVTFPVAQASSQSTNDQSQVSCLSLVPLVSHVEHVCMDGLSHFIIESCKCVFAGSHMHLSLGHTLSHFSDVLMTELPCDSQTITELST